ncbi:MAG: glycosyltransferase family 4 protein [Candidatus Acidiferrales bacterium]
MSASEREQVRVLVGIPEKGSRGGPAACEPPFIRELRKFGVEVAEETYAYADTQLGFTNRVARVLSTARRFREHVRRNTFDIVHINSSFDTRALLRDVVIVPRLRSAHSRIFLKFHGSDARLLETRNPALSFLRHRLLGRVGGIGVLSSEERANFLRAGIPERKLFQVKNVVERNIHGRKEEFFRRWELSDDRPLLLFIGRFIPTKGLLDVIRACTLLRDRGQKCMLLCLGDGPVRSDAEAEVERHGLQKSVRFFGYIPERQTVEFYASSTILLFPTYHYEGFPMVIFNAAAAGLPIITTRIRAAADYLKEPDNCLWVEPKRPDMLAEKIIQVLESPELRARMSSNNRQLAEQFSAECVTREYVEIYKQLASVDVIV